MATIDYEKKYKETLERAKKLYEQGTITESLSYVFPELAESEDERMKEAIIATIHLYYGEPLEDEAKEMIAWLEKQGEQKPVFEMKTPEESLGIDSDTYSKIVDECVYGEQKPAAWSEEDETVLNNLIWTLKEDMVLTSDRDTYTSWLKSLKDRVQPQPKQEWSEEDRNKIADYLYCLNVGFTQTAAKQRAKDICDLLRPQNTWRPSEGQLECLGYAIEKAEKDWSPLINNRVYLTLKALKEQLKKLREE